MELARIRMYKYLNIYENISPRNNNGDKIPATMTVQNQLTTTVIG